MQKQFDDTPKNWSVVWADAQAFAVPLAKNGRQQIHLLRSE
jgi:hypothetical protein